MLSGHHRRVNATLLLRIVAGVLLTTAVVAAAFWLPVNDYVATLLEWTKEQGPWGAAVLAGLYVPACLLFVPGSLLTLGAGFALGMVWGTVAASVGGTLGATAAFLAGRTLARGWVEGQVARSPRFAALDSAVGREGFRIVFLTRLSPVIPYNLLNYAYGLTQVRLRDFVLASWIGMLPGAILYVYLGTAAKNLADLAAGRTDGGPAKTTLLLVGLAATVAATWYVSRLAQRALQQAAAPPPVESAGEAEDLPR